VAGLAGVIVQGVEAAIDAGDELVERGLGDGRVAPVAVVGLLEPVQILQDFGLEVAGPDRP